MAAVKTSTRRAVYAGHGPRAGTTPLAKLINSVRDEQGVSYQAMSDRAARKGHSINKRTISKLQLADPVDSLVPSTLRALAAALEVPLARVVEAALPSAGLDVVALPTDWSVEQAVRFDPDLSQQTKRTLLAMLSAARSGAESESRSGRRKPPPTLPAKPTGRASSRGAARRTPTS